MKTAHLTITLAMALALAACGNEPEEPTAADIPKGNFTISSPVDFSEDPAIRQEQQQGMVESMLADPGVSLDIIEGEAARRGVTLTDEQRSAKRAQQAANPVSAPAEAPAG